MSDVAELHRRTVPAKTVTFPAVWGRGVSGRIGETHFGLSVGGEPVSRVYRAERSAQIDTGGGPVRVRVAGLGGLYTPRGRRRQGYGSLLARAFVREAEQDGFDLAMLFCLEHLVGYYRRLGWLVVGPNDGVAVSYQQPDRDHVACPAHIFAGVHGLERRDLSGLRSLHVEGFPW